MSAAKANKREKKAKKAKKAAAAKPAKKASKPAKAKAAVHKAAAKPLKAAAKKPPAPVKPAKKAESSKSPAPSKPASAPKTALAATMKKPPTGHAAGGAESRAAEAAGGEEPLVNPYGASDEAVEEAGEALGVVFPKTATRIWKAINGGEINDWKFHPLREPSSGVVPKGDIISANSDNRPEDMPDELISVAEQDGNHLVLEKEDDRLLPDLLLWDHDSGEVDAYSDELANFAEEAEELRDELLASRRR